MAVDVSTGRASGDGEDHFSGFSFVLGSKHDDRLLGGSRGNGLGGGPGNDLLKGRGGIDFLLGSGGNDVLAGGPGRDIASYFNAAGGVRADLVSGRATTRNGTDHLRGIEDLFGSRGRDQLSGNAGRNRLVGDCKDDVLNGRGGNDTLVGEGGFASFFCSRDGADSLDGGPGRDTASYGQSDRPLEIDLRSGRVRGEGQDRFTSVENLIGSRFGDRLSGNVKRNYFFGGRGPDDLSGRKGEDLLDGAGGTDSLNGGPQSDTCLNGETTSHCEIFGSGSGAQPSTSLGGPALSPRAAKAWGDFLGGRAKP